MIPSVNKVKTNKYTSNEEKRMLLVMKRQARFK